MPAVSSSFQHFLQLEIFSIPDFYGFVTTAGGEQVALRVKNYAVDGEPVRRLGVDFFEILIQIPHVQMCIPAAAEQVTGIGAVPYGKHGILMGIAKHLPEFERFSIQKINGIDKVNSVQ